MIPLRDDKRRVPGLKVNEVTIPLLPTATLEDRSLTKICPNFETSNNCKTSRKMRRSIFAFSLYHYQHQRSESCTEVVAGPVMARAETSLEKMSIIEAPEHRAIFNLTEGGKEKLMLEGRSDIRENLH